MIRISLSLCCLCVWASGCTLLPQKAHEPRLHNPFPQLSRVAVLPFFNQSGEPTLNGFAVANIYRNELQKIPGFEVMPVGVVERLLLAHRIVINEATDLQELARTLDVDVVAVGAITDFNEYYPPRMGLAVNWYAANPCFQPIPPGFGLPWGTAQEEFIPESLRLEAEFVQAREQMHAPPPPANPPSSNQQVSGGPDRPLAMAAITADDVASNASSQQQSFNDALLPTESKSTSRSHTLHDPQVPHEPIAFPTQTSATCVPHRGPIIELVRQYNGHDAEFTKRLENYYYFRDDARFGGWQSYLQRKEDFIGFCCYLHIAEMLTARGGADETRVVWRRPNDRYER